MWSLATRKRFAAELVPGEEDSPITEIDLANPVSLKRITKAATARLEWEIIQKVLAAHRGSRRKTAQWLNISYRSLLYKLEGGRSSGPAL